MGFNISLVGFVFVLSVLRMFGGALFKAYPHSSEEQIISKN